MKRGRPKKEVEVSAPSPEVNPLLARQKELLDHLTWMQVNRLQDIGQVEVALSQVNKQLEV